MSGSRNFLLVAGGHLNRGTLRDTLPCEIRRTPSDLKEILGDFLGFRWGSGGGVPRENSDKLSRLKINFELLSPKK